jgi:putative ABC transport system substrate-binding protein
MRRRELVLALGGTAITWPRVVRAQKAVPVIGFLHSGSPGPAGSNIAAFQRSLSENGFVTGQNVAIEYQWAESHFERLPAMAADLVGRKVDLIIAGGGTPSILAAKAATSTIPIVFANAGNPVETGLVVSLARPGGNLTGVSILFAELTLKRIELLAELVPQARVIGLLVNPKNPTNELTVGDPREAARTKGVQLLDLKAGSESEIDAAFAALVEMLAGALIVGADVLFMTVRNRLVALASRTAVPAIYAWREFVEAGGLISYAPSITGTYHQVGIYAAKILKGSKPGDLPVEQPTRFEVVINLKAAKALGVIVPPSLLARADEVIE